MRYGHFDDAAKEYVITRPDTPASWSNYLGTTDYGAVITNNAGGYGFFKSGAQGRFLRLRFNGIPMDQPGWFITDWGCATESPKSRFYESDGYWRGPIWAPPMMMLCEGLDRGGGTALARDLAGRFCRAVARSGAAENFDAVTGQGLRDRAYAWTSSVFLLLANRHLTISPARSR